MAKKGRRFFVLVEKEDELMAIKITKKCGGNFAEAKARVFAGPEGKVLALIAENSNYFYGYSKFNEILEAKIEKGDYTEI